MPVIFGDATLRQTLQAARIDTPARSRCSTHDDMVNIETGIVLREMLGRPTRHPRITVPEVPTGDAGL